MEEETGLEERENEAVVIGYETDTQYKQIVCRNRREALKEAIRLYKDKDVWKVLIERRSFKKGQ